METKRLPLWPVFLGELVTELLEAEGYSRFQAASFDPKDPEERRRLAAPRGDGQRCLPLGVGFKTLMKTSCSILFSLRITLER